MFLDLFNNTCISERTSDYIISASKSLIKTVTDSKGILHDTISLSHLKYRERDDLEFVLKFYITKPFQLSTLWDTRLRTFLKSRYDSRDNVFDWDYNMKLLDGDPRKRVVHKKQYCKWRNTGSWYLLRSNQTQVNKTMATVDVMKIDGVRVAKYGVFSDTIVGPFQCFGIDSENKDLLKIENERPTQVGISNFAEKENKDAPAVEGEGKESETQAKELESKIAEVEKIVETTDNGTDVCLNEDVSLTTNSNIDEDLSETTHQDSPATPDAKVPSAGNHKLRKETKPEISNTLPYRKPPVKLHLLPCDPASTFNKPKTPKFDIIYLGSSIAHRLQDVNKVKKQDAKVYVELIEGVFEIGKDERKIYRDKIVEIGESQGLKVVQETIDFVQFQ
ncbi:Dynein assembly factor 3, axonemal [Terramyces sp. JEL0728]|nr:Dynein assembly factor 3, axonemal [Terramyces sp. JEL0728]